MCTFSYFLSPAGYKAEEVKSFFVIVVAVLFHEQDLTYS